MTRSAAPPSIPHDVRLVAAVSRLVDLHQSRRESGVYVPETQERAGHQLALALILIDTLREFEMDRGPSFVAIGEVLTRMRERVSTVTADDLDFVIDSLASERDIRFGAEDGQGGLTYGLTKDSTPLIEKARGFEQVQLSENGRLLLRVSAMKESWLYSDLDAERLVKAIERGQFEDIPRFCRMMILEIATKNRQLSSALERPTLAELRDMLIEDGSGIAASLREAIEVIKQACALIFDARTRDAFDLWRSRHDVPYSLGNLQTEVELVMQNVEALSRRFVRFLETAQRARATGGEGIPFLAMADALVQPAAHTAPHRLEAILAELMPWGMRRGFFHPLLMVGAVDFASVTAEDSNRAVSTFTLDPSHATGHSRLMDFILRNRAQVIDKLRHGPASFAEMIASIGFELHEGESPIDFFGVYTAPEHLNGEGFRLIVGVTGNTFDTRIDGRRYVGSDPMMFLTEESQ